MKKHAAITYFILTLFMAASPAMAEGPKGAKSITPYLGYHWFTDRDYEDRAELGIKLENFFTDNFSVEGGLGYVPTNQASTSNSKSMMTYTLNGNYNFILNEKLWPYITAGLGGDTVANTTYLGPAAGIGLRYLINNDFALRTEVKDVFFRDPKNDVIALVGLTYFFGRPEKPVAMKEEKPADSDGDGVLDSMDKCPNTPSGVSVDKNGCPVDSDKDGVADYLDKCADTPSGVSVDKNGCPIDSDKDGVADYLDKCADTPSGVSVDKNGCPLDSDKDGVPDYLDKCADTPSGVSVDTNGCPVDSDKDGVPDYLDKCPGTPGGSKVDTDGCVVSITLSIKFDSGKSIVKSQYNPEIERFANFLKENQGVKVEIQGHTDNVGNAVANKKLSEARAEAIREKLIKEYGIASDRITAKGYGEEKPIASNDTPEGRLANRRVEAVVQK